ncbi:twin-arginine translocation signal domain-containing protein [Rhodobacter sp. SGA-6-6]|nr:twin-arginine translocation signal domain-containing protein [Rhodobacter sp. SGA-6-6]
MTSIHGLSRRGFLRNAGALGLIAATPLPTWPTNGRSSRCTRTGRTAPWRGSSSRAWWSASKA